MSKMIRIQFELPQDKVDELEELMKDAGISTKKDLLNNAVTLFDWAVSEKKKGNIIASINETTGRTKELIMPAFSNLNRTTQFLEVEGEIADSSSDDVFSIGNNEMSMAEGAM